MQALKKYGPRVAALSTLGAFGAANAAIDVAAVVTEVGDTLTPIGLIGAAVLLVYVGIKAFRWVRGAMA